MAWIRPGRAAWSWWSSSATPRSLEAQKLFVDLAASAGWEYTLVDEGWNAAWVPELIAYAGARGVRILLWIDRNSLASPSQRDRVLSRWASWGVAGAKIDFLHSDSGTLVKFMVDAARAAAKRHMIINFHGVTVPRGLQRTWPNVMTLEGVLGAENNRQGAPISPVHNVNLVFTRNVIGSMDYTPVTFSANGQSLTLGHQLAQAIVYESGLQHYADTPQSYAAQPDAMRLLSAAPAAWDDTLLVDGAPDRFATLARRIGVDWFVGSLSATGARAERVRLGFLAPKRRYVARLTTDDGAGALVATERVVTAADAIEVQVAENGGFTIHLRAV